METTNLENLKKPSFVDLPLQQDGDGQRKLTLLLADCFGCLKTYGKEPAQLEAMNRLFQMMLGKYPFEKVRAGFMKYMERNSEMPAPADIINIIDPYKRDYSGVAL